MVMAAVNHFQKTWKVVTGFSLSRCEIDKDIKLIMAPFLVHCNIQCVLIHDMGRLTLYERVHFSKKIYYTIRIKGKIYNEAH